MFNILLYYHRRKQMA